MPVMRGNKEMAFVKIDSVMLVKTICDKIVTYSQSNDLDSIEKIISFKAKILEALKNNIPLIYVDEIVDDLYPKMFSASPVQLEVLDELVVHSYLWDEYLHAAILIGDVLKYPKETKNILSPVCKGRYDTFVMQYNEGSDEYSFVHYDV